MKHDLAIQYLNKVISNYEKEMDDAMAGKNGTEDLKKFIVTTSLKVLELKSTIKFLTEHNS